MKSLRSSLMRMFVLSFAVLAGATSLAQAQNIRGKFTLTRETHWGPAVLPSGDYEFSLDASSFPARVTVWHVGGSPSAVLLSMARTESTPVLESSQLKLEPRGNEVFVSALYLKDLGLELDYAVPKENPETLARNTAKLDSPMAPAEK